MSDNKPVGGTGLSCGTVCWIGAAVFGIFVAAVFNGWLDFSWLWSIPLGVIAFVPAGIGLGNYFCGKEAEGTAASTPAAAATTGVVQAAAPPEAAAAQARETKAVPAKKATATKAPAEKAASGDKPALLTEARGGQPDDLKMIKGVGPALEKMLHGMGIYHFDQIAEWNEAEVEWVDDNMGRFSGRVKRDGWIEQAKLLAEGGETEFSKRAKKDDIYS